MTFRGLRGGTFLAVFAVAAVALVLATVMILSEVRAQLLQAIEGNLVAQARIAAALVSEHPTDGSIAALDAEADRIGGLIAARVTLVAADGRVVGDSAEDLAGLARMDNHNARPEIAQARASGVGVERRHSATIGIDQLYVAVAVRHPQVAVVRLALPLTEIDAQVASARRGLLLALCVALLLALGLAWLSARLLARRVDAIASVARRYAEGDFSRSVNDAGRDELGTVARVLDDTAHELGRRIAELAQDRARIQTMLAGMLEGVVVMNSQGTVMLANEAAHRMLRLDADVTNRSYEEAIRQPDLAALIDSALGGHTPAGLEFTPPRDTSRTVVARVAPIDTPGSTGAVLVLHDITDLRQVDKIRRDFVANVSHELRTPLTAIQGYVEALQDEDQPEPEETRKFLGIIFRHAKRLERLVHDLLRLARIEAGQEPVERTDVRVASILAEVTSGLAPQLSAKRQLVVPVIDPSCETISTDAAKLHDALRNLVENAIAYAPADTTIEIAVSTGSSGPDGGAGPTVITVSDSGPGIPEADLTRIFERFYRVDKARSRESGGTGLGLSIVKHLVGVLGGECQAANRPQGGAIFTVTLPS